MNGTLGGFPSVCPVLEIGMLTDWDSPGETGERDRAMLVGTRAKVFVLNYIAKSCRVTSLEFWTLQASAMLFPSRWKAIST